MAANHTSSSTMDFTQNPGSVYYLHPSDHSSLKLVSVPFDGTGFSTWKRSMIIGLSSKNKKSFIDGTLVKPSPDSPELPAWERCNTMLFGWLISSLDRNVAKSVMYYNDAREIWRNLEDRFGQTSSSLLYQEDLSQTAQDSQMSIAEYYTKVKGLWDEIDNISPLAICICSNCSCDLPTKYLKDREDQRLTHFLMKLHDSFQQVRGNIFRMKQLPSAAEAYNILLQEQRHQELSKTSTPSIPDSMAFLSDKRPHYERPPFKPRSLPDFGSSGRVPRRPSTYYCEHCKMSGHSIHRCYKLHGYPPSKHLHSKRTATVALDSGQDSRSDVHHTGLSDEQFTHILNVLGRTTSTDIAPTPITDSLPVPHSANIAGTSCFFSHHQSSLGWIIDSGASDHMCHYISSFTNLRSILHSRHEITIPDGRSISVSYIGDVRLHDALVLKDVLYVPQFKFNLISVCRLCNTEHIFLVVH